MSDKGRVLTLFDVDGTLTAARQKISPEMKNYLLELRKKVPVALVGGSDLVKILEQMGGDDALKDFEFVFSENGLVYYKQGEFQAKQDILKFIGEPTLQRLINHALAYMSKLELPAKRGTFVEFRSGMLNLCPVGRSCSQTERNEFAEFDRIHGVRTKFVADLESNFADSGLVFAIGGQISIDVYPKGWDKRYCLQFLEDYETIHFFGDKTAPGGNDHEIFEDSRTIGHSVTSPEDTRRQCDQLFGSL